MRTPKSPLFLLPVLLAACATDGPTAPAAAGRGDLTSAAVLPSVLALPNGFAADGITFGPGSTFYVGSLTTGAVWRGDAVSGAGGLLVQPQAGRSVCGITYDPGTNRLYVAGAATGQAYVYDATTGATLAVYQLADPAAGTDLLDVKVLGNAVYFTDMFQPVLYRIPLGPNGALPPQSAVQVLPFSGDLQGVVGTTGMVATADQHWLLVTNVNTGMLSRVDPATGQARTIDLGGGSVPVSDGLALIGQKLYVSLVANSQIAVVDLSSDFTSGVIEAQPLQSPALDFQSKIATFGSAVYAVNAHFELNPDPTVAYQVVRVSR